MVVVCGLVRCAVVLMLLKVTLTFMFLNRLVIFLMCGEECVKVAHFVSFVGAVGGCGWLSFLSISRKPTFLELDIYRKPTAMDTTINFLSNHRLEHKLAAYRFFINRILSLPLNDVQRHKEWKNIKLTAHNNNIPIHLLTKLRCNIQRKLNQPNPPPPPTAPTKDTKWATFTHTSPHVRKFTILFKNTNVQVTFKSINNSATHQTTYHNHTLPCPAQREWHILINLQHLQTSVCRSD
jgi:hypothetical protein